MINMELSAPEMEKLAEEPGEEVAGYSTERVQWRTRYDMKLKVMGFKQSSSVEVLQDFWVTDRLTGRGLNVWLRSDPPKTGNESFDSLVAAEMEKVDGLPLKSKTVTTTVDKKGRQTVTSEVMRVVKLEVRDIEDGTFEVPTDYEEVPMLPGMGAGEGQPESPMESLRGLLGRKKKKGNR